MNDYFGVLDDFSFDEINNSGESGDYSGFNFDSYEDASGGTEYDDYIYNSDDRMKIEALGGNDFVENTGSNVYIDGGEGFASC